MTFFDPFFTKTRFSCKMRYPPKLWVAAHTEIQKLYFSRKMTQNVKNLNSSLPPGYMNLVIVDSRTFLTFSLLFGPKSTSFLDLNFQN